jgi:4-aminobutyrate aminotransferase-like enzyme
MAVSAKAMEFGLSTQITAHGGCGVFRLTPPLTITPEEMDEALDMLDRAFEFVLAAQSDKSVMPEPRL